MRGGCLVLYAELSESVVVVVIGGGGTLKDVPVC